MVIDGRVIRPYGGRLTVEEVAVLLGVPRRADGRYYLKDICTAAAINIWSARKPVRNSLKNGNLTLDDFKAANYGFDLASILSTASTLPSLAPLVGAAGISAQGSWNSLYRTPRGRLSQYVCEWLRLLDFNGYYHYAEPPYDSITPSGSAGRISGIRVFRNSDAGASAIALEDLTGLTSQIGRSIDQWRLGVVARRGSTYSQAMVHAQTISDCWIDSGTDIYADLPDITVATAGTWEICVFLTDYNPADDPNAGYVYSAIYIPSGYASVYVPAPGPTPVLPDVYPGEIEFTPDYDPNDDDLIGLYIAVPFEWNVLGYEPEVTLHTSILRFDDGDSEWVELASGTDTVAMISSGDYCEVDMRNFSYPASELYLDMWYQVTGDPKYYVFDHVGTVYQAATSAQRDALLESLRTISIEDILNDNA